jgi:hypothetical protein
MQLKLSLSARQLLGLLLTVVALLAAAGTAVQVAKYGFQYREGWTRLWNLDREYNLPSLFSTLLLAGCAVLLRAIAQRAAATGDRWLYSWRLLSAIFVGLALDEWFSIHEILIIPDLAKWANLPGFLKQIWVIPAAILVTLGAWKFWPFWLHLPPKLRWRSLIAGVTYVSGALLMEMIGGIYSEIDGQQNLAYALLTVVEEVAEMLGTTLFLWALLVHLGSWSGQLSIALELGDRPERP